MTTRRFVLLLVTIALGVALRIAFQMARDTTVIIGIGSQTPEFAAATLDGSGVVKTMRDYRGQVVLLNLWATWCGPCVVEMPSIERLHQRFKGQGLRVVGVSTDDPQFADRIRAFVVERGVTFEILHEGSGAIETDFRARGLPATYLIGRDGRLRVIHQGAADWDAPAMHAVVARLLAESR